MLRLLICTVLLIPQVAAAKDDPASKGEQLYKTGKYAEAKALLEGALQKDPNALAARLWLGRVYRATGDDREKKLWNAFFDDYETNNLDKKSARDLTYVALA